MTPEQLKASILQYAFQGKLVEQRPEEGTAEDLYKTIQEEKQKLIKEGKIKKEKTLDTIAEDEIPFDIPSTWKWCYLGEIFTHTAGKALNAKNTIGEKHKYITTSNVYWDHFELDNLKEMYYTEDEIEKYSVQYGDLLVLEGGDVGRTAIWDLHISYCIQNHIHRLRPYAEVNIRYFYYVMMYLKFRGDIAGKGIGIKGLSANALHCINIPLPPLAEQHRIVAKIEELLPFVDRYAASYEKLEQFNAKFPEDMKKSILQYAIQGKLVEQRPEEGTAEELYQQIQDERKKYKIKELSIEAIDEFPFDIPETWKWVHLQDIVKKTIKRGKSPKYTEKSEVQVFAQKCNVKTGGINMELALFLDEASIEKYPTEEYMCDGDIVINSTGGGTMGRVGVFHDTDRINDMAIVPDGHVTVIRACDSIDYKYLYYFIKHNQKFLETQGEGSTNQTELKPLTIASLVLPLPPLEEQHRIVSKIEEMLPYCDRLVK